MPDWVLIEPDDEDHLTVTCGYLENGQLILSRMPMLELIIYAANHSDRRPQFADMKRRALEEPKVSF